MTGRLAEDVFRVSMGAYGIDFCTRPAVIDLWANHMLEAQAQGKRLISSDEWSKVQRYINFHKRGFERYFSKVPTLTGTVLDYSDGTLKEGVTLNDDGTIKDAKIVLGEKQGIYLPSGGSLVRTLFEPRNKGKYVRLMSCLYGLRDPEKELFSSEFDEPFVYVRKPEGIIPVVRAPVWPRSPWQATIDIDGYTRDEFLPTWFVSDRRAA